MVIILLTMLKIGRRKVIICLIGEKQTGTTLICFLVILIGLHVFLMYTIVKHALATFMMLSNLPLMRLSLSKNNSERKVILSVPRIENLTPILSLQENQQQQEDF